MSASDWEQQRAFLAVLREGSLSGAARVLGVAQPTVRRRIEDLEAGLATACETVVLPQPVNGTYVSVTTSLPGVGAISAAPTDRRPGCPEGG